MIHLLRVSSSRGCITRTILLSQRPPSPSARCSTFPARKGLWITRPDHMPMFPTLFHFNQMLRPSQHSSHAMQNNKTHFPSHAAKSTSPIKRLFKSSSAHPRTNPSPPCSPLVHTSTPAGTHASASPNATNCPQPPPQPTDP
jgi:hypothetical protein